MQRSLNFRTFIGVSQQYNFAINLNKNELDHLLYIFWKVTLEDLRW